MTIDRSYFTKQAKDSQARAMRKQALTTRQEIAKSSTKKDRHAPVDR